MAWLRVRLIPQLSDIFLCGVRLIRSYLQNDFVYHQVRRPDARMAGYRVHDLEGHLLETRLRMHDKLPDDFYDFYE